MTAGFDLTETGVEWIAYELLLPAQIWGHMTEISSFALITSFFLRDANERNTR